MNPQQMGDFLPEEEFEDGMIEGQDAEPVISDEDRARAMGWKPRDEYHGEPRRWTDAETFIRKGEQELPVLRDQNRRMSEKLVKLERTVSEQTKAVAEAMQLARTADTRGYERAKAELLEQRRQAVAEGNTEAFDQAQERIDAMEAERAKAAAAPPVVPTPDLSPETQEFFDNNPWFRSDKRLREAMIAEHQAVLNTRPHLTLSEQYTLAKKRVVEAFPDSFPNEVTMPRTELPTPSQQLHEAEPPASVPTTQRRPVLRPALEPTARHTPRTSDPFMRIADETERQDARAAFATIAKYDPKATADEYVSIYLEPHGDVLALRANRRSN